MNWSNDNNVATACSMGNLFKDKLCNIVGSNALLLLPDNKDKEKTINDEQVPGLLIDCPGKYLYPLSNIFNLKKE